MKISTNNSTGLSILKPLPPFCPASPSKMDFRMVVSARASPSVQLLQQSLPMSSPEITLLLPSEFM